MDFDKEVTVFALEAEYDHFGFVRIAPKVRKLQERIRELEQRLLDLTSELLATRASKTQNYLQLEAENERLRDALNCVTPDFRTWGDEVRRLEQENAELRIACKTGWGEPQLIKKLEQENAALKAKLSDCREQLRLASIADANEMAENNDLCAKLERAEKALNKIGTMSTIGLVAAKIITRYFEENK